MKRVELLAPAGNYETMLGAFNAGADAVYLGGQGFGARAFADNFTNEEVVRAIKYAHLQGKKIYLTVNTLLKEKEIPAFKEFFAPFAYAGLDGAIIQDFGIFKMIRETYPWVELHVSTQMTITGRAGAKLLMDMGASRVVPARELSLEEIRDIHDNCKYPDGTSIEIEAFIHGAMCYCYSGACLFSSMVGERSGNRGRCAQPCRLPYRNERGSECYPLSLKDMCMADRIPELIEAGIDSFKIEGRMKKPEYAAGVTSVYRKYIDKYYELWEKNPDFKKGSIQLKAGEEDRKILSFLYLRSETGEGYYFKHNGKDMITLSNPAYNGSDDAVLKSVRDKYITGEKKVPVSLKCTLKVGEPCKILLGTCFKKASEDKGFSKNEYNRSPYAGIISGKESDTEVVVKGDEVQAALKKPMSADDIKKQLSKFGNTFFDLKECIIDADDAGVFMPNKSLNELRRKAVAELENALAKRLGYHVSFDPDKNVAAVTESTKKDRKHRGEGFGKQSGLVVSVLNYDQLSAIMNDSDCKKRISKLFVDSRIVLMNDDIPDAKGIAFYAALPYITRRESFFDGHEEIKRITTKADKLGYKGVLARNTEQIRVLKESGYSGEIITDYGLYIWNHEAFKLYGESVGSKSLNCFNLPLELNMFEAQDMLEGIYGDENQEKPVAITQIYGRVPMMHTANCLKNTLKSCSGNRGKLCDYENGSITDRTGRNLPVTYDCTHCTNIIWNSVPVSLFKKIKKLRSFSEDYRISYRIDLTTENAAEARDIIMAYENILYGDGSSDKKSENILAAYPYTTGHFERSAD